MYMIKMFRSRVTDTRHTLNVEKRIGFSRLVIGSALIGAGMALSASGPGLAWAQVRSIVCIPEVSC